jgi:hypothetical protein
MKKQFKKGSVKASDAPIGLAPYRRGRRYRQLSQDFVDAFPVGTRATKEKIQAWVNKRADLPAWYKEFFHAFRQLLHRASTNVACPVRYDLVFEKPNLYAVVSLEEALSLHDIVERLQSLSQTKHEQLQMLMEGMRREEKSELEIYAIETLFLSSNDTIGLVIKALKVLDNRYQEVSKKLGFDRVTRKKIVGD